MAKTSSRRVTPTATPSKPATPAAAPAAPTPQKLSVVEFVSSLSEADLAQLRALMMPPIETKPIVSRVPGQFPMKVRTQDGMTGYYEHIRRRSGDVFICRTAKEFSSKWMEPVDASTPEVITTGKEELRRKHDEILASRRPASGTMMVHDEPMADTKNPLNPLHA